MPCGGSSPHPKTPSAIAARSAATMGPVTESCRDSRRPSCARGASPQSLPPKPPRPPRRGSGTTAAHDLGFFRRTLRGSKNIPQTTPPDRPIPPTHPNAGATRALPRRPFHSQSPPSLTSPRNRPPTYPRLVAHRDDCAAGATHRIGSSKIRRRSPTPRDLRSLPEHPRQNHRRCLVAPVPDTPPVHPPSPGADRQAKAPTASTPTRASRPCTPRAARRPKPRPPRPANSISPSASSTRRPPSSTPSQTPRAGNSAHPARVAPTRRRAPRHRSPSPGRQCVRPTASLATPPASRARPRKTDTPRIPHLPTATPKCRAPL